MEFPSTQQLPELQRVLRLWSHLIGDDDPKIEFKLAPIDSSWVCYVRVRIHKDNEHQASISGTVEHALHAIRDAASNQYGSNFRF